MSRSGDARRSAQNFLRTFKSRLLVAVERSFEIARYGRQLTRARRFQLKHPERCRLKSRVYSQTPKGRETNLARGRVWYARNRELKIARNRAHRTANLEHVRELDRAARARAKNRITDAEWADLRNGKKVSAALGKKRKSRAVGKNT